MARRLARMVLPAMGKQQEKNVRKVKVWREQINNPGESMHFPTILRTFAII